MGDHLRQERIVTRTRRESDRTEGVHSHAGPARRSEVVERARRGQRIAVRRHGFHVDAGLDRDSRSVCHGSDCLQALLDSDDPCWQVQVLERNSVRDRELHGDEVDSGDLLGHRVLHLNSGIDLEEDEAAFLDEELDRRDAAVADLGAQPRRRSVKTIAQGPRQPLRGRNLDQLLMATLDAAIAVPQSERVGSTLPRCRHDLHFDVPSVLTEYLGEQCRTAESRLGFGRTHTVRVVECFRVTHRAHAAATAAAERLDHDAAGVALEEFTHLVEVGVRRCRRQDRHS